MTRLNILYTDDFLTDFNYFRLVHIPFPLRLWSFIQSLFLFDSKQQNFELILAFFIQPEWSYFTLSLRISY
jgi:hypothetical protein